MNLIGKFFAWNDRRRARDYLQQICEDKVAARRKLDELDRKADRAMQDAQRLEHENFREGFFAKRDPVHDGFAGSAAKLFGITEPTRVRVSILPLASLPSTKCRTWHRHAWVIRAKVAA